MVLLIASLSLLPSAHAGTPTHADMASAGWSHLTDRNHDDAGTVKVYSATVAEISCFKATAQTEEADAATMLGVVTDIVGAKRWSTAGVSRAEVLGRSGNTVTYFQYLDVPGWTMSADRFWFLTGTVDDSSATKSLEWNRIDPSGPYGDRYRSFKTENPKAVEPPVNVGGWYFTPAGTGASIEYRICTDAGGSIPYAIQNAATKKTLPDTVGDVVREAKKRLEK